jgi:hypothetical protein
LTYRALIVAAIGVVVAPAVGSTASIAGKASRSCGPGAGDDIAPGSDGWTTMTLKPRQGTDTDHGLSALSGPVPLSAAPKLPIT